MYLIEIKILIFNQKNNKMKSLNFKLKINQNNKLNLQKILLRIFNLINKVFKKKILFKLYKS